MVSILRKYMIPFSFTIVIFLSVGFFPTDCDNISKGVACPSSSIIISDSCTYKNYQLYGKIKFVESFPDIKVQIVNSFPDLKVKIVESFPDDCGEWKIVESFPDLKVQVVESFPDLKIKFVESFPGKR